MFLHSISKWFLSSEKCIQNILPIKPSFSTSGNSDDFSNKSSNISTGWNIVYYIYSVASQ